jgi:hypothetical protein
MHPHLLLPPFLIHPRSRRLTAAEGDLSQVVPKLQRDLGPVIVSNWKLWVPFQFVNFRFVPPSLQVAAANACAVVWNVVLSLMSHAKPPPPPPVAPVTPAKKGKAKK